VVAPSGIGRIPVVVVGVPGGDGVLDRVVAGGAEAQEGRSVTVLAQVREVVEADLDTVLEPTVRPVALTGRDHPLVAAMSDPLFRHQLLSGSG
jgi:hypothetical protein